MPIWPSSPTNGQQLTVNGQTYVYSSATGVWNRLFATTLTNVAVSGSNTQVQFNDGNSSFGATSTFTFDKNANTLVLQGNANVTTITGNVTGTTLSGTSILGTINTGPQPNITSVGTLTSLNVTGYTTLYTSQDTFSTITAATGTVTHNTLNGAVFYHTSPSANFTPNFTNVPTANNYSTVVVLFINQGVTAYMPTATANVQVNSANVTVKWLGQTPPSGTATGVDMVSYSIIRAAGSYTVLGQGGGFA